MPLFTDLLDEYLLNLGEVSQMYINYTQDPLLYTRAYSEAQDKLLASKNALNSFFADKPTNKII